MDERLKHRLVGAAVLVSLGVIFIPMVLDNAGNDGDAIVSSNIPPKPAEQFSSRVVPVREPVARIAEEPLPAATVEAQGIYGALPDAVEPSAGPVAAGDALPSASGPGAASPPAAHDSTAAESAGSVTAWAVQLGSFSNAQNAIALRDRLREQGYTAFVESAPSGTAVMTRVYVGPELVRGRAVQVLEKLRTETKLKGIVVRYPAG